jgi:formylglycine-generating enzyme required for sulfatase activity
MARPGQKSGETIIDFRHSVGSVSFDDCKALLDRLGLALPTEDQWEHAACATTDTPWFTGHLKESLGGYANLADAPFQTSGRMNMEFETSPTGGYSATSPVGAFDPNPFGLHDTAGSVMERCERSRRGDGNPLQAPEMRERVMSQYRVSRGGSGCGSSEPLLLQVVAGRDDFHDMCSSSASGIWGDAMMAAIAVRPSALSRLRFVRE